MDDFLATFVPKFAAIATTRIARTIELATRPEPDITAIARELHSIAGEAGLLGLTSIVALARAGEDHVKRLRAAPSDSHADALRASPAELKGAIDRVSAGQQAAS